MSTSAPASRTRRPAPLPSRRSIASTRTPKPQIPKSSAKAVAQRGPEETHTNEIAPGLVEIKGQPSFKPPAPIAQHLDAHKVSTVNVRFGSLAEGPVTVKTIAKGNYRIRKEPIPLMHPVFAGIADAAPELAPVLVLNADDKRLTGKVALATGSEIAPLADHLKSTPSILGMDGITFDRLPKLVNTLQDGSLRLGLKGVPMRLGSALSGSLDLETTNDTISFSGNAAVQVKGLAQGNLELTRSPTGLITGKAVVGLTLPKNLTGSVDVAWDGVAVTGEGKVGYQGEKLSGEITLRLMEKSQAEALEAARKAPEGVAPEAVAKGSTSGKKPARVEYVVFGEGNLDFAFTDWLNGKADVIVDPKGYVTIIGQITPQKEFELFPQKDYVKKIFKVEVRASYGIPVVGNIFIFANVGMDAFAKLGPAKFYNIVVEGTYSTDPKKSKNFSFRGSLNISAGAGVRLRGEAGAGLEVLAHDIKAGAGVNGIAAIKGYAEATPTIGYREKAADGEDKKGEFFIRGDLEIAAQPFLGLSGDLFVEIDAPWWSPVPDKKWTWPLGGKEWPLGGTLGIGASMDYVFGSGQWPKLDFKPVEFSAEKFMTDLYQDKAKSGSGKAVEKPGKWQEKNSKATDAPSKTTSKGNAAPGRAPTLPSAKSRAPTGRKAGKPVSLNARTVEGKSVKQLQDEAAKRGKKPTNVEAREKGKSHTSKKDPTKSRHDEELKKGLAALEQVTARYAKNGASKEEIVGGVKSVRRKFKVFKSIEVVDGGKTWNYLFEYNPKETKKGPNKSEGGTGTKKNPFRIPWPKRPLANYSSIFLVPPKIADGKLYKQNKLKKLPGAKEFSPNQPKKLFESEPIGVTVPWRTRRDKIFEKAPCKGRIEKEKERFNRLLKEHGYDRETGTSEGTTDADHVCELQMVGSSGDAFPNLWPLNSSENRSSGSSLRHTRVILSDGKEKAIGDLAPENYSFKIVRFTR